MTAEEAIIKAAEISSNATIKGVIWGTFIGTVASFVSQGIISKYNHKKEIERIKYVEKRNELKKFKVALTGLVMMNKIFKGYSTWKVADMAIDAFDRNRRDLNELSHCANEFEDLQKINDFISYTEKIRQSSECFFEDHTEFRAKCNEYKMLIDKVIDDIDNKLNRF